MEIVIDIPEGLKQKIDEGFYNQDITGKLWNATKNGTPRPKGHGDLIDRGELEADAEWNDRYDSYTAFSSGQIANAPAIIKADKESERV